jgi:sugar lactone lactonase YvrE
MKKILLSLLIACLALGAVLWVRYGGGERYPDLSTTPLLDESAVEQVLSYAEPIGNVAVSAGGRVFFTVHPEARPEGARLLEWVDDMPVPFPDRESQSALFDTVLGIVIDRSGRLWTIDHGTHGLRTPRLLAFDLDSRQLLHDKRFDKTIAPAGSFLQDLQVSPDGDTVVIADASFWRQRPGLVIYDVSSGAARRVLDSDPSVSAEHYVIHNSGRAMTFLGGMLSLRGGVDGIALGRDWLYFAALSGSSLYRVPLDDLRDASLSNADLARQVERVASKPLSDGLSLDADGRVYVTDVEHHLLAVVEPGQTPRTLVRSRSIRWPDALSFGPDGWLYIADSALADVVLQPREHILAAGPFRIFRVQAGSPGFPGQ